MSEQKPVHILGVISPDGRVDIFAEKHVRALIVNAPVARTVEQEIQAEQLLDSVLPRSFKDVHWPGLLRGSAWFRRQSFEQIEDRLGYAESWDSISEWAGKHHPTTGQRLLEILQ